MRPSHTYTLLLVAVCVAVGVIVAVPGLWPVALAIALAVLVFSILIREPATVLLAFVATRPLADTFVRISVGPLSLGQVWSLLLIAAIVVCLIRLPTQAVRNSWVDLVPYAFVGAYALLTLWRPDYVLATGNTLRLLSWVLLIQVTSRIVLVDGDIRRVLASGRALGMITVVAVTIATVRGEYGMGYYFNPSRFSDFLMSGPHGLAALCVFGMAFPLVAISLGVASKWDPILAAVLAGSALLSFTRTGILALGVVLLGVVLAALIGRRVSVVGTVMALGLGVLAAAYTFGDRLLLRVVGEDPADFVAQQLLPSGGSGRVGIWFAMQAKVLTDPLGAIAGYGAGSTTAVSEAALGIKLLAHNDFLELVITGGVGLLLLYAGLVVWMWIQMGVTSPDYRGAVLVARSVLLAFLVFSVFNGIVFSQASIAIGLMIGMFRGMRLIANQEPKQVSS